MSTLKGAYHSSNSLKIIIKILASVLFDKEPKSVWKSFKGTKLEFLRKYLDKNMKVIDTPSKHKYLFPLNKKARRKLMKIALPYPKSFDDGQKMKNIKLDLSDCVSK